MCSIFPSHSVIGVSSQAPAGGGGFQSPAESESTASSMSSGGAGGAGSLPSPSAPACSRSWSISEDSLRRYVSYASESCIQELLAASDSGRDDDGWKVLVYHNGVEISKRRTGPAHVFRSRWLLQDDVSPEQFMAAANAVDAAKQWETDQLVESSYIRELGDDLSIIHLKFGDASSSGSRPRPARGRRDVVVYERRQAMDDGTLVVAVASLPKEIAAGLLPPSRGSGSAAVGRSLLLQSGWVVERLAGDGSCVVTYVVQLDPAAGWLPRCIVSRLNSKLVMIVDKLRKIAQATVPATAAVV